MASDKPRILQGNRDIVMSMVVLSVIVLAMAGVLGLCSFSPGGPEEGPVPEYDAAQSLRSDARNLDFAIREPEVPEAWQSNSGSVRQFGDHVSSHIGYVTEEMTYIELVQSDAPVSQFRDLNDDGPRPDESMIPVAGNEWTTYTGEGDVRPVWVYDFGDARVGITGLGTRAEFEQLALAISEAPVLPSE